MRIYYRPTPASSALAGALIMLLQLVGLYAEPSYAEDPKAASEAAAKNAVSFPQARASAGVTAVLDAQAAAWNRGDLEDFLSGYVQSEQISFVSSSGEVWGYDALRARYQKRYGDKHDTMGTLKFSDLKVQDLGKDNALCIGHWHLERSDKPAISGIFSLIFSRTKQGWKIIHDHTSVSEPAPKS